MMLCFAIVSLCLATSVVESQTTSKALTGDQLNNKTVYDYGTNFCRSEVAGVAALNNISKVQDRNNFSALLSNYMLNYYDGKLSEIIYNTTL